MPMTVQQIKALLEKADYQEFKSLERALAADSRKGVASALNSASKRLETQRAERERIESLYTFEQAFLRNHENGVLVGLDEVGRGSVAGPLAVGAVVLPTDILIDGLDDSKKIKPERRMEIAESIKNVAITWTVAYIEPHEIDRDGMTVSLRRAFKKALDRIDAIIEDVDVVLIDGNPLHIDEREQNVIKGDAKCASIAAASIIAKTERDRLMMELSSLYPSYYFDVNKGYASPQHIEAIRRHGLSPQHRVSFCRSFLQETLF